MELANKNAGAIFNTVVKFFTNNIFFSFFWFLKTAKAVLQFKKKLELS